ncbi:Protein-associating with the carboxyl-terminal domain of ezrin [Chamberlinius hualienensis]
MGNESSILNRCKISEKSAEVNNWRVSNGTYLHESVSTDVVHITLFEKQLGEHSCKNEEELCVNATKCLKIYRHPSIVKFLGSGRRNGGYFLVTEQVKPLSGTLLSLSALEICSGLYSVMSALSFCHEKCNLRHNNFGIESVFVASDGTWKVAGMEFACLFEDYTEEFRQKNRSFRNESIIPPEDKRENILDKPSLDKHIGHSGDVYALGSFMEIVLENVIKSESLFGCKEFMDYIKKEVLISDWTKRPKVSKLMEHSFFQNDFLNICMFLKQITLKGENEKNIFFRTLTANLRCLPEELVASRLSELLLSRFVLMDTTAEKYFLSSFFKPRRDEITRSDTTEDQVSSIISSVVYKTYVIPHVERIFEVHDRIIRRVLLIYFEFYAHLFDPDVLKQKILPEVLLSVKDTNNELVVLSLRALACLVPLLGSDIVIGGQRHQYFSESQPKIPRDHCAPIENMSSLLEPVPPVNIVEEKPALKPILTVLSRTNDQFSTEVESNPELISDEVVAIPEIERSSPDGSESSACRDNNNKHTTEDTDWLDWDDNSNSVIENQVPGANVEVELSSEENAVINEGNKLKNKSLGEEYDIMALEIKPSTNEEDFFADMQPTIVSPKILPNLPNSSSNDKPKISFAVANDEEEVSEEGWDDL